MWLSLHPAAPSDAITRCRRHVTEEDFDVGGPLHHVQMELLLWASYRGQLLSRTVRGEGAVRGHRSAAPRYPSHE